MGELFSRKDVEDLETKQFLPLMCVGMLSLASCATKTHMDADTRSNGGSNHWDEPHIYGTDSADGRNGIGGVGATDGIDGISGMGGMDGMGGMGAMGNATMEYSETLNYGFAQVSTEEEVLETASWDLMIDHGQYHATSQGKVYPYGDAKYYGKDFHEKDLWSHAKDTMEDSLHDAEDAIDHMGDSVEKGVQDFMKDVDSMDESTK